MSHCVISAVMDTDDPLLPVSGACVVHTHWAPCPHDGEPASPEALHTVPHPSREEAISSWERKTRRQRPLVLHRGTWSDRPDHNIETDEGCWCDPEFFAAEQGSEVHP